MTRFDKAALHPPTVCLFNRWSRKRESSLQLPTTGPLAQDNFRMARDPGAVRQSRLQNYVSHPDLSASPHGGLPRLWSSSETSSSFSPSIVLRSGALCCSEFNQSNLPLQLLVQFVQFHRYGTGTRYTVTEYGSKCAEMSPDFTSSVDTTGAIVLG